MDWLEQVDNYCERATGALWAEPLNAVSNLAFVIAAWAIWRMLRSERNIPVSVGFTAPLALAIGIGSFAFHTLATRWAQLLDIAPIGLFVLWYLAAFLHWFYRLSWIWSLLGVVVFTAVTAVFIVIAGDTIPNGSGPYVPVLILLVALTATLRGSRLPYRARHWKTFGAASAVFGVALTARTVDESICGSFSPGTHFLWHALDGLLIFLVSRALIQRWRSATADEGLDKAAATGSDPAPR